MIQARVFLFLVFNFALYSCAQQEKTAKSDATAATAIKDQPHFSILDPQYNDEQIAEYVVDVFEDQDGNIWMGTVQKGVAMYDGNTLKYYTPEDGICGNTISSIVQDKDGTIWFASHTGLCKYEAGEFATVWESAGVHNIGIGWIGLFQEADGRIWASSNKGLYQLVDSTFEKFEIPFKIKQIDSYSIMPGRLRMQLQDSKGNIWVSIDGGGLVKINGDDLVYYTKEDGLCSNVVTNVLEDSNGDIWISCVQCSSPKETHDGGLCRFDGLGFETFPKQEGLLNNDIYTIFEDSNDCLWVAVVGIGVYRLQQGNWELIEETDRMDLTSRMGVQDILEDSAGNLWFGFSGGLFRWDTNKIINVTKQGPWHK